MAADVTTGPQIMATATGFVGFCAVGWVFARLTEPIWPKLMHADRAAVIARVLPRLWLVLAAVGLVAVLVGLIVWLTGTTFGTT